MSLMLEYIKAHIFKLLLTCDTDQGQKSKYFIMIEMHMWYKVLQYDEFQARALPKWLSLQPEPA